MKNFTSCLLIFFILIYSTSYGQSTANYDISVTTIWNSTDHTSVPGNAHWSPLAGATHKMPNDILEFAVVAPVSNGIKDIAETGNTSNFETEINNNANANQFIQQGFSPFAGNNSNATLNNITISEDFPYITLVSMVAPSPDWFIAINSLSLRSGNININNGWKNTFTLDMFAYDAGTDSGMDYTSANLITTPREPISMVSGFPINGKRMATITFTYNSSTLSSDTNNNIENTKIYPNPTKGVITISKPQHVNLKSIEIYNVLGHLVKQIPTDKTVNNMELNLSFLKTGIYLIKLNSSEKNSKIEKLIVE